MSIFDELEVPNLDCLEKEELKQLDTLFSELRLYCWFKSKAMEYRENGKIEIALTMEQACDQVYNSLPKQIKW